MYMGHSMGNGPPKNFYLSDFGQTFRISLLGEIMVSYKIFWNLDHFWIPFWPIFKNGRFWPKNDRKLTLF